MLLGRTPTFKLKLSLNIVQICVIIVLFVSFHTYGVGTIELFNLSIAPWDWVILGLSFIYIILVLYKTFYIRKSLVITIIFALLFAFSLCLSAFFSPQPERALTMILLQIRNVMLLLVIGTLFSRADTIESINKKIFWTGGIIASLAVLMYLSALSHYSEILPDPSRWKPGVNYILDQGGVLRLVGLSKDPNFYSLWMAPSFLAGLSLPFSLPRLVMMIVLGLSLALTFSRGFTLALFISSVILTIFILLIKKRLVYVKRLFSVITIFTVIAVCLASVMGYDFLSKWEKRLELARQAPRYAMWQHILDEMAETWNPLIGAGLRAAEETLEGMYSHNSYLDTLFETGLIGFLVWVSLIIYVTLCALRRIKYPEWLPWVHTWLILVVMFAFFSLVYHPFPWLMAGILTASPFKQQHGAPRPESKRPPP